MIALPAGKLDAQTLELETFHDAPGRGRISYSEREYLIDLVEDCMLNGLRRMRSIMEAVNRSELARINAERERTGLEPIKHYEAIGNKRTCQKYIDEVWERRRNASPDPEAERMRLLDELEVVSRRQNEIIGQAQREKNLNAQVGASRNLIAAIEKRAELLGIRSITLNRGADAQEQDALRNARYEELMAEQPADPIRALHGAVLQDPAQGHRTIDSDAVEPASVGDTPTQT